jgi:hypothetical protein
MKCELFGLEVAKEAWTNQMQDDCRWRCSMSGAGGRSNFGKVFLILDNLKVHHILPVKQWLAKYEAQTEVFYMPSYSPELNPDECLNADLKDGVTRRAPARTKGQLKKAAISHLRKLQNSPKRVAPTRIQTGALCSVKTFNCRINSGELQRPVPGWLFEPAVVP